MTDLPKFTKNNFFTTNPAISGLGQNPRKSWLFSNPDDNSPIVFSTIPYDSGDGVFINPINSAAVNIGVSARAGYLQYSQGYFLNKGTGFMEPAEEATLFATAYATNTTTQLAAAPSGKYKIFRITATIETGAAADTVSIGDNAGVNNIYSFPAIGAAVAKQSLILDFGPNGVAQPTGSAAISIKANTATCGIAAFMSYAAGR